MISKIKSFFSKKPKPKLAGGGLPEHMECKRRDIADRYLKGDGIEIGALNAPLKLGHRARVRCVDRYDIEGLRSHYPELADVELATVDIVDDGETLASIENDSLDFIIANHMLEHCENPLGAMRNHLAKIKKGGILYYAIPDKRFTFDKNRELTSFEHFLEDDEKGCEHSRLGHYQEYARLVDGLTVPDEIEARVNKLHGMRYSIHFHVWDHDSFQAFLARAVKLLGGSLGVDLYEQNDFESIAILRKS